MELQRSNTVFGLEALNTTSKSDDQPTETSPSHDNHSVQKLRKRSVVSQDDGKPRGTRLGALGTRDRSGYDVRLSLKEPYKQRRDVEAEDVKIKDGSPWVEAGSPWEVDTFEPRYKLSLNDLVIIASREDASLVAVRIFSGRYAEQKFHTLNEIKHEKFLAMLGCFLFEKSLYIILEHDISEKETIAVTLSQFGQAKPPFNDSELANVLGQVSPPFDGQRKAKEKILDFRGS
jgi:hypothetical protein